MKKLKPILILLFVLFTSVKAIGQSLTYTFIDPCTKEVTYFSIPIQSGTGTTIFFLGQQRYFTANDVASGVFATWINQSYSDYRKISPCSVQQGQVIQNQITSQIIGSTIQSVVGSIMSQAKSESSNNTDGGVVDASGKDNKDNEKKSKKSNGTNNSNGTSSSSSSNQNGGQPQGGSGTTTSTGGSNGTQGGGTSTGGGGTTGSGNSTQGGSSTSQPTVGGGNDGNGSNSTETKTEGSEVVGTTTMTIDANNDRGNGGSNKSNGKSNSRTNPVIVSSDLTNAQNLDRSYTGIINVGMSQSSLTGTSSWGVNSMIWFNFKQYALTGRYTKIHYSKNHKIKLIHNFNLTGVYSYGNILGFLGYSAILNAGKWGITGINVSGAATKTPDDNNLFMSPSATAFYTKPFKVGKRMILSPELYVISTPLIYSSVDKVTVSDRTFSAFIGTGVDYQISKRFKLNMNYKLNMSTNPDFPILSFFLIGSKINL